MPDPEGFKAGSAWMNVRPNIDEAEWRAKIAAAVESASAGAGPELGRGLTAGLQEARPALAHDADAIARDVGKSLGDGASTGLTGRLTDELPRFGQAGQTVGLSVGKGIAEELPKGVDPGLTELDKKVKDSTKKTAAAAGAGMSPLLIGAFTAAATVGPTAILGATAIAVIGAGALITKGNTQLRESYVQLGQEASAAITQASAPLIPALYDSVQVLEQGVAKIGPELKGTFAAVAPDATAITGGFVSLVENTLPGLNSGLRSIAPYTHDISTDLGKLGSGVGGLFGGLSLGAGGATTGFNALIDDVDTLLVDIGKLAGSLSNGLGPALHDISNVAIPVANAFTDVVDALPPRSVEAAAAATAALFAAFKLGSLTGIVAEGTSFIGFLRTAQIGEVALTAETESTSLAMRGMGLAMDAALGPLGLIAGAMTLFGLQSTFATGSMASFMDKIKAAVVVQQTQKQATVDAAAAQVAATESLNNVLATNQIQLAQSAGKAGDSAVAALSFSTAQNGLNDSLSTTIAYYNEASGAASAYGTASDALFGKYQSYSDAQAKFTIDLDNAAKGLKAGKDGFDRNTDAGAKNYQLMSTLATANENRAEKLLKETGSQDQANKSLQAGALALDNTARKAGFTASQVDALNLALYGTKNIGSITVPISANTGPALDAVGRMIRTINNSVAYVQVAASGTTVGGRQLLGNAGGGPVTAGSLSRVGEHGEETVMFAQDGYVLTHGQTVARDSRPAAGPPAPSVTINYYGTQRPTPEQNADMMRQMAASLT